MKSATPNMASLLSTLNIRGGKAVEPNCTTSTTTEKPKPMKVIILLAIAEKAARTL